jgi:hypothetical protein
MEDCALLPSNGERAQALTRILDDMTKDTEPMPGVTVRACPIQAPKHGYVC